MNCVDDLFGNFTQVDDEFLNPFMAELGDEFPDFDILKYSEAELDELLDTDVAHLLDKIESGFGGSNLNKSAAAGEHQHQNLTDVITQKTLAGQLQTLQFHPQMQQSQQKQQEALQLQAELNRFKQENSELQAELNRFKAIQMNPQKLLETLQEMEQHKQVQVSYIMIDLKLDD